MDTTKTVTFDVLMTELYQTIEESNKAMLSNLTQIQDPLELLSLMSEFTEYSSALNSQIVEAILTTMAVDSTNVH